MFFSIIYAALWLVLIAYWIYGIAGNKPNAHRLNPAWRLAGIVVFFGLILVFRNLPGAFRSRVIAHSDASEWTGIAVCAAGVAFAIWARRTLGTNWSGNPTIKVGHELIQGGPYRFVRHPIYTGILLAVAGTVIGNGRVKDLLVLAFVLVIVFVKIRIEEGLMTRQFPQAYPEYRKRTKAIIPFVL